MTEKALITWYISVTSGLNFRLHDVTGKFPEFRGVSVHGPQGVTYSSCAKPEAGCIYERELHLSQQYFGELWWVLREGPRFVAFPPSHLPQSHDLLKEVVRFLRKSHAS